MKDLDAEECLCIVMEVAAAEPEALEIANGLAPHPAHNTVVNDVEFDAVDEAELLVELNEITRQLASNQPRAVSKGFEALGVVLQHATVHMDLNDSGSAIRMLETVVETCTFDWKQSRDTFFATPCQQFFQDHRVAWETALSLATTVPPSERTALMRKLIRWDPTVELRLPDEWSVIFNECREDHFAATAGHKIIIDVHELWEKMKRTSVTATQRLHADLTKDECVTVSNANLGIIVAEAERFTGAGTSGIDGGIPPSEEYLRHAGTEMGRRRAAFAQMVAQNGTALLLTPTPSHCTGAPLY